MVSFSELFGEKDEIIYNGDRLLSIDRVNVGRHFNAEIEFVSTNSELSQGIAIVADMITINGKKSNEFFISEKYLREQGIISISGESKTGMLLIYNICERMGCVESFVCNMAMKKEQRGNNEFIYYCNDTQWDENFDDLIFKLRVL